MSPLYVRREMNRIIKYRAFAVSMACLSASIGSISVLLAMDGKVVGYVLGPAFLIMLPLLIRQASHSDEWYEKRIRKDNDWIFRHPIIWKVSCIGGFILAIYSMLRK